MTRVISMWLSQQGHDVVRAGSAVEALDRLRGQDFDLLITDVDMPEMDGLALLSQPEVGRRLRGVIVITGRTDYSELMPTGCVACRVLPKPFSPTRLAELVHELLDAAPLTAGAAGSGAWEES
jgi:CheY-like chemotaxis protein